MSKSFSYEYHINKINCAFLKKNMSIIFAEDNEELFNQQSALSIDDRYCYFLCYNCGVLKKSQYGALKEGRCAYCPTCGSKQGSKTTSTKYQDLIEQCVNAFNNKNIKFELTHDNEEYFYQQTSAPTARYCLYICPTCHNSTRTQYRLLKRGEISCCKCRDKKASDRLSYSYQDIIHIISNKTQELQIDLKYQDNNERIFNTDTEVPSTLRTCYYYCPCCLVEKQSPYRMLLMGRGYFCKSCTGSLNENIFSLVLNDIFIQLQAQFNLEKLKIFSRNDKHELLINNRKITPDYFIIGHSTVAIEYNGRQHYQPIKEFGGQEAFLKQQIRDEALKRYCANNNIFYYAIDGRNINYSINVFINHFKTLDFIRLIANITRINVNMIIEFMQKYEMKENINIFLRRNKSQMDEIIIDYFVNKKTETEIAESRNTHKNAINRIMHLYLDGILKLDNLDVLISWDIYNKLKKHNRLYKLALGRASKLKENEVRDIVIKHKQGISIKQLSLSYNVTTSNIGYIINGKSWKHIWLEINGDQK